MVKMATANYIGIYRSKQVDSTMLLYARLENRIQHGYTPDQVRIDTRSLNGYFYANVKCIRNDISDDTTL